MYHCKKANTDKKVTTLAKGLDGPANGIVRVKGKEFLLTSWGGIAYYILAGGSYQVVLDIRKKRIAVGINLHDPSNRVMCMTTYSHNTVIVCSLK